MLRDVRFVRLIEGMCSLGSEFVWNFSPPSLMCGSPFFFLLFCTVDKKWFWFILSLGLSPSWPLHVAALAYVTFHW